MSASPFIKVCSGCGLHHTRAVWDVLRLCGYMDSGVGGKLELRNCLCGSTISIPASTSTDRCECGDPREPGELHCQECINELADEEERSRILERICRDARRGRSTIPAPDDSDGDVFAPLRRVCG